MKSFTKEEILNLLENPTSLKNAIIESKGFVLYQSAFYKIDIPKKLLIDTINQYSIRFMVQNFKDTDYSKKEIELIASFIKEDAVEKEVVKVIDYNYEKLIEDINNDSIPRNLEKLIKISTEEYLKNQEVLTSLLNKNDDDYFYNVFYSSHPVLQSMFSKINKDDFFKINLDVLTKYPSIFHMAKHLMNDTEIKQLFNKVVDLYYEQPEIKRGGYRKKLEDYQNYNFDLTEKDLFISLLNNEYQFDKDYKKISKHNCFSKFFEKKEYILQYDIESVQYFSKKEISDNIEEIKEAIKNNMTRYQRYEKLYELKIEESSFTQIFSSEFIKELILNFQDFDFSYFDRDYKKKVGFANYFHKQVYKLAADDDNILSIVTFQKIMKNLNSLIEHNRSFLDDDYKESLLKIFPKLYLQLKSNKLFFNIAGSMHEYEGREISSNIIESMQGKESINYLLFLNQCLSKKGRYSFQEEIKRVIPLLNHIEVINLYKTINEPLDKKLLNYSNPPSTYEDNVLNFNVEITKKMSDSEYFNLLYISDDFRKLVINNNLEDRMMIINEDRSFNDTFKGMLKSIENNKSLYFNFINKNKSPYFNFIKEFINKNKDYVLTNYFEELLTHACRESLIKIDTKELENNAYEKIENNLENYKELLNIKNDLYKIDREILYKKDKKHLDRQKDEAEKNFRKISEDLTQEAKKISFKFCEKKIKEKDIEDAIILNKIFPNSHNSTLLEKLANLNFTEVDKLLDNKIFLNFLDEYKYDENKARDSKEFAYLNKSFTNEQNIYLVEKMLKNFNNTELFNKQYTKFISLANVLCLIDEESKHKISNQLVIKHDPENMFNSYDYLPNSMFKKHVKERFSTEQILEAIQNLNNKGKKIICIGDQNLSHDNLLSHNYETDRNTTGPNNPNFKDYINLLKNLEKDPINYLACIHSDIVNNFISRDGFEYIDVAKSDFYNKYINVDIVVEAMKKIFTIAKEVEENKRYDEYANQVIHKGINIKNAIKAVSNFISFTYYSDDNKVISNFDEDKSRKILKTLIDYAPNMLLNVSKIGKLGAIETELEKNLPLYYNENFIEDFFTNNKKTNIVSESIRIEYEKRKKYWQSKIADSLINTIIDYNINSKNSIDLQKLDFILKEYHFNDKERGYDKYIYDFNTPLTELANKGDYKVKIEKGLLFMDLLEETKEVKKVPNKRNKI